MRDGGGIKPDVEVKPDSLPNIAYYLSVSGLDSTEVMLNYEIDYIAKHPTIAPAGEFKLTDQEYEDFKQQVIKSGFKYDAESSKELDKLKKIAKFEGYYDDAKEEFDALEKKFRHNLATDLDRNKQLINQIISADIVAAYYFQAGAIENNLNYDKQMMEACRIINDRQEYTKILTPAPKQDAKDKNKRRKTRNRAPRTTDNPMPDAALQRQQHVCNTRHIYTPNRLIGRFGVNHIRFLCRMKKLYYLCINIGGRSLAVRRGAAPENRTIMQTKSHLSVLVHDQAKKYGDREVLVYKDFGGKTWKSYTWNEFSYKVKVVSNALLNFGVKPQENIGIFSQNSVQYIFCDFGAWGVRAVTIPFYATSSEQQIQFMINDAQVRFLFVGEQEQYDKAHRVFSHCPTMERIIIFDNNVKIDPNDSNAVYFDDFLKLGENLPRQTEVENYIRRRRPTTSPISCIPAEPPATARG